MTIDDALRDLRRRIKHDYGRGPTPLGPIVVGQQDLKYLEETFGPDVHKWYVAAQTIHPAKPKP